MTMTTMTSNNKKKNPKTATTTTNTTTRWRTRSRIPSAASLSFPFVLLVVLSCMFLPKGCLAFTKDNLKHLQRSNHHRQDAPPRHRQGQQSHCSTVTKLLPLRAFPSSLAYSGESCQRKDTRWWAADPPLQQRARRTTITSRQGGRGRRQRQRYGSPCFAVLDLDWLLIPRWATDVQSVVANTVTGGMATVGADPQQKMTLIKEAGEQAVNSLGRDLLLFLATSVAVVPLSKILRITPVLGFLAAGALLGPHALHVFSNSEADLLLGDIGILFLLFSEGLNLSPSKIQELGTFKNLGIVQLFVSMALFFFGILLGGPVIIEYLQPLIPHILDPDVAHIFQSPVQAFCIASAGSLSSSAFVLPVLKEKQWSDRPEGVAALSVLLLQDLAVAPLLVLLPLVAGSGPQSAAALGILVAKATLGFGLVLALGSVLLRYVFDIVAAARSTETFVAAALIVALGMGQAAEYLGLSATTGAFAAGVLLAGNQYRAQIKADVRPFEGILLGIFFLTAGGSLDFDVVAENWDTLLLGIFSFLTVKAAVLFLAGPGQGKTQAQAARVAITLAGGGEFSLVLFNVAQDLDVLDDKLFKLLTASVIISMSLTPVLANLAEAAGNYLESFETNYLVSEGGIITRKEAEELFESIDADGSSTIDFAELRDALLARGLSYVSIAEIFNDFDLNGDGKISKEEWMEGLTRGLLASSLKSASAANSGTSKKSSAVNGSNTTNGAGLNISPKAIVICGFTEFGKELYEVLEAAGMAKNGGVVAFDLNPARIEGGLKSGANVCYGDGASPAVLFAAGIQAPKAVIIAYRAEKSRVDAVSRLRAGLPSGTPIYARAVSGQRLGRQELLDAGSTDVVSERTEAAIQFARMVGAFSQETDQTMKNNDPGSSQKIRQSMSLSQQQQQQPPKTLYVAENGGSLPSTSSKEEEGSRGGLSIIPGIPNDRLIDLSEEFDCSVQEMKQLYEVFSSIPTVAYGDPYVSVKELRDLLLRTDDFPIDDSTIREWVKLADGEEKGTLSFVDFARAYFAGASPRVNK